MNRRTLLALLTLTLAIAAGGCEQSPAPTPEATTEPTSRPNPFVEPFVPPKPLTMPTPATTRAATTAATTGPATTRAAAATRSVDPLATPESAVRALLELSAKRQVPSLDTIISWVVEPPPDDELVAKLNQVRRPLLRGASWEITDSITHDTAAVVLYTLKPPQGKPGKPITVPMLLMKRYGRWKMVFGELTPLRYTEGEKNDLIFVMAWGKQRVPQLDASAASQPSTAPAATTAPTRP
jgi:hypothetical protein